MRSVWQEEGIPVMGSSLVLRWLMLQVGVMRRSEETRGFELGVLGSEGTVMRRGMSVGVVVDILGWRYFYCRGLGGDVLYYSGVV